MSVRKHRATGSAAIASTLALSPARSYQIKEFRIHLDAAGGAAGNVDLTVRIDAVAGAAYDVLILSQDMTLITDILFQPKEPIVLNLGDELDVVYANGGSATWGLEITFNSLA